MRKRGERYSQPRTVEEEQWGGDTAEMNAEVCLRTAAGAASRNAIRACARCRPVAAAAQRMRTYVTGRSMVLLSECIAA